MLVRYRLRPDSVLERGGGFQCGMIHRISRQMSILLIIDISNLLLRPSEECGHELG